MCRSSFLVQPQHTSTELQSPGRQQMPQKQEITDFLARNPCVWGFVKVLEAMVVTVLNPNILLA